MPHKKDQLSSEVELLRGWKNIAAYLGIPTGTAQRWAKDGMPVRREAPSTVADPKELSAWLGRESHMPGPAQVMTGQVDMGNALKESIAAMRNMRKKA